MNVILSAKKACQYNIVFFKAYCLIEMAYLLLNSTGYSLLLLLKSAKTGRCQIKDKSYLCLAIWQTTSGTES